MSRSSIRLGQVGTAARPDGRKSYIDIALSVGLCWCVIVCGSSMSPKRWKTYDAVQ